MTYGMNQSATGTNPTTFNTGAMKEKIPSGYKKGSLQQFTPEQMELFQQMFGHVGPESYLSKLAGGDQSTFGEIEAPALRQFSGVQGNLASRFSGMGGLGARRSSGFQNTMTSAASNFAQELQAQRQGIQRQALRDLMGLSSDLLGQRPYENFMIKKQQKKPFWQQLLGMISPLGGDVAEGGTQNTENFFNALKLFGGG
jgi:hypothetical protein